MGPYSEGRVLMQRTILFWMLAGAAEGKLSNVACPVRGSGDERDLFRDGSGFGEDLLNESSLALPRSTDIWSSIRVDHV